MRKGFTLVEFIIVILLFSVLIMAASWAFVVGLRVWDSGRKRAGIRQESSWAMERMVREISQASSITDADEDEMAFVADLDDDDSDETITFSISDNELIRTEDAVDVVLARNVQTFSLSYRDYDNTLLSIPSGVASQGKRDLIRVIIVSLTMNNADETITLSSSLYVRNQPEYEE